jgi:hypothetical protein
VRTSALQREISVLRRSLFARDREEQAPSSAPASALPEAPMAYAYDAPLVEPKPSTFVPEPAAVEAVPVVNTATPPLDREFVEPSADSTAPAERRPHTDLEDLIGGKWLNAVGLAAVLLATAFFLKYAFDSNWIGPVGRVALGLVSGSAVLVVSQWIARRGWIYFSEGLTALGAGILYLSLYAAWNFYHLIPPEAAFGGLAVVTGLLIVVSLRRDSQRLATLALLGGYAAPLLVSTGHDNEVALFAYLALLNVGLLWMALARDWRALPASFVFAVIYGTTWYVHFYDPTKLVPSLVFASIFFLQFACLPAVLARRDGVMRFDGVALTLLNAAWYLVALDTMLYSSHRWLLTAMVLATGVFFIFLTTRVPLRAAAGKALARPVLGSIAFALVTVAIPIRLEGQWIDMAWAIEATLLVWMGLRFDTSWLRWNGVVVLVIEAVYIFASPLPADRAFLNGRFATFLVVIASLAAVRWLSHRYASVLAHGEESAYRTIGITANAFAVYELSAETLHALWPGETLSGALLPLQAYGLTLLWVLYAFALAAYAKARDSTLVRWQAWILVALVLCKGPITDFFADANAFAGLSAVRALTFLIAVAAMAAVLYFSRRHPTLATATEQKIFAGFEIAINVYAVWAISIVASQAFAEHGVGRGLFSAPLLPQQILAVTVAWTIYALGLATYAYLRNSQLVRWQAWCLFALIFLKAPGTDFSTDIAPHSPLSYIRILIFAGVFGAALISLVLGRRSASTLGQTEKSFLRILEVALNVYGVWAFSIVIWQGFAGPPASAGVTWSAAQQLGLSITWTVYAVVLIAIGVWRDSALIRWQALALFALVILKAFLFDLSLLALGYRIASFLVLGLMLLGASFLYQRRLFQRRPQEPPR